jgi:L-ascorbate metabolism protein UlaG (beta-lactamase superfamily)
MIIKWFAHACFLIEGDGLRIVTDPYTPGVMGFAPVSEAAGLVIRSSADDAGHCNAAMISGSPTVVTATELPNGGAVIGGLRITAIPAQESLVHKESPLDNAMYRFTIEGISMAHFGDVGNRLSRDQVAALEGSEIVFVPTGGPPTIDLDDLCEALSEIRPRLVIPMHYHLPATIVRMLPVTDFTSRFPAESVDWIESSHLEVTRATLPSDLRVAVLQSDIAGG